MKKPRPFGVLAEPGLSVCEVALICFGQARSLNGAPRLNTEGADRPRRTPDVRMMRLGEAWPSRGASSIASIRKVLARINRDCPANPDYHCQLRQAAFPAAQPAGLGV